MKHFVVAAAVTLSACALGQGASEGYAAPAWNRSYCGTLDWKRQGAEDGKRYQDGERRLQALDEVCGKHLAIPRGAYLDAFNAAKP